MPTEEATLGDLISDIYDEFLALYDNPARAAVATATVINDMLADGFTDDGN